MMADVAASALPSKRIVEFAGYLRRHGFILGPAEIADMTKVAALPRHTSPRSVSNAFRALACRSVQEWRRWAELFDQFWFPERVRGTVRVSGWTPARRDLRAAVAALPGGDGASAPQQGRSSVGQSAGEIEADGDNPVARAVGGATRVDPMHDRDGQWWQPEDLAELQKLARRISRRLRPQPVRRRRVDLRHGTIDLRWTLRRSVGASADLRPVFRRRAVRRPPMLIFIDVSRSMETFAVFGLRAARALVEAADARVFVFHTRSAEITDLLRRQSARVQEQINALTGGFSGGTRIAAALDEVLRRERGRLPRGARVWIYSDGYDTDAPEALSRVLAQYDRRGARITWLYPTRKEPEAVAYRLIRTRLERAAPLATLSDLRALSRQVQ